MNKTVVRGTLVVAFLTVVVLATGIAHTGRAPTQTVLGVCEPEQLPDPAADGWEFPAHPGNWGGKDESEFAVVWGSGAPDEPRLNGREAMCSFEIVSANTDSIRLTYLQGLANDDFCVFVEHNGFDVGIGCPIEDSPTEQWVTVEYEVPDWWRRPGRDVTVKIMATGDSWSSKGTYGQLAIDKIEVLSKPSR